MTEELLPFYNQELYFLRKLGKEFAEAHPKIAARLRLGPDATEDPHVERLIEACAYLTARIRHKLEDDFPEIAEALLGVVYPHYVTPLPSMAVVQFALDEAEAALTTGLTISRDSEIETEAVDGEPCRFRTCYPVTLWPIKLESAALLRRPFVAPSTGRSSAAAAVLRLQLRCMAKEMTFSKLEIPSLRFFLRGPIQQIHALYELIFNHTLEVALAESPRDRDAVLLRAQCIRPVGFERDEGMFPYPPRSFLGYRLLSELFTFPEKFLFFDVADWPQQALTRAGNALEIYLYLNRSTPDLEQHVSVETFALGCAPMVNLFAQRAEPIALTQTETEYRIVPDARRPLATEIYSVDRVTATSPDGEQTEYVPFYSFQHGSGAGVSASSRAAQGAEGAFWHATRRAAGRTAGEVDPGTEVFLTLVDLGMKVSAPADWTLDVETTSLNRDLPRRLPFGGGRPYLQLTGGAGVSQIVCLTPPTPTYRPPLKHGLLWRLISHLSLNHLSLSDHEQGADALKEILRLYDFADSAETRMMIDSIAGVRSRRVVGRVSGNGAGGFCRGVEVRVDFDEAKHSGGGVFLFACVLERFLGLYCSINSFSKLVATVKGREGELRRWSPRAGEQVLL